MLKTAFLIFLALGIAVVGGGYSVWYALQAQDGVGVVTVGAWTAYPDVGTADSDPYSKARVAREGVLALGRAEGLSFSAQRDSAGAPLLRQCSYRIEGVVPSARFWTLHATDPAGALVGSGGLRAPALHSYELLRSFGDAVVIAVAPRPAPGNWLATSGSGAMALVLTLYDTPIASSTGLADIRMPNILKVGCNA